MYTSRVFLAALAAVAGASSLHSEDLMFANLLKRQEPGSASYNCHDNCGTAITLSRQPNPCDNEAFVTNYNNCLTCSGPDNFDIWKMYGRTLSNAGSTCGFETEPKSGQQPDVGPAMHAASASAGASAPAASTTDASATAVSPGVVASAATSAVTNAIASDLPSQSVTGGASPTASLPVEQTTNAAAGLDIANAGVLGAIFVGAVFGL